MHKSSGVCFAQGSTSGLQGAEVWEALGEWVTEAKPQIGPGTRERFEMAAQLQPDEVMQTDLRRGAPPECKRELRPCAHRNGTCALT